MMALERSCLIAQWFVCVFQDVPGSMQKRERESLGLDLSGFLFHFLIVFQRLFGCFEDRILQNRQEKVESRSSPSWFRVASGLTLT